MPTFYVKCARTGCDKYGEVGDPFLTLANQFPGGRVPEGWWLVMHRSSVPNALGHAPEDPFCSLDCLQSWAATAKPRDPVPDDVPFEEATWIPLNTRTLTSRRSSSARKH